MAQARCAREAGALRDAGNLKSRRPCVVCGVRVRAFLEASSEGGLHVRRRKAAADQRNCSSIDTAVTESAQAERGLCLMFILAGHDRMRGFRPMAASGTSKRIS